MIPRKLHHNLSEKVGYIAFFTLEDWWRRTFTEDERRYIIDTYQPLGAEKHSLINTRLTATTDTVFPFLSNLASWFDKPADRTIAKKIIYKAEEYATAEEEILDLHFSMRQK